MRQQHTAFELASIARCEAAGDPAGLTAHPRGMLEGHRAEMQRVRTR